jgi:oligosaccharide repeat unit polymerase
MLSITLFLLAIVGLIASKKMLGDYFTPPAIYNFFWSFALGLLELDLVSYDPLRGEVWRVIGISYVAFMGGCFIVFSYAMSKGYWKTAQPQFEYLDPKKFERVLLVLFAIGLLGFAIQFVHLMATVGLGTFLSDPQHARETHTNVKYLGFFNILNVANFVLAAIYLLLYKKPSRWVVLIMVVALVTTLFTTDRTRFFYMVIWTFYAGAYCMYRFNLQVKTVLAGLGTFALLLLFFLGIAKLYVKEAFEDNMEFINVPQEYAPLIDPYIYITGSFPVLQAFLEDDRELSYGKLTFEPYVKVMELFMPTVEREKLVGKFYRVPIELNVCTYLEPYYRDFGIIGAIIGPLLTGLLCCMVYVSMRQRKTLFSVYFMSILSFCTTISIFVNHYTQTATLYFVIVGYVVYRLTHSREPVADREDFRNFVYRDA